MGEGRLTSIIPVLMATSLLFGALQYFAPVYRRATHTAPTLWQRVTRAPSFVSRKSIQPSDILQREVLTPDVQKPLHTPWFRDVGDVDVCGVDLTLANPAHFELNLIFENGQYKPMLATSELLFLAWVSHRYQINPHFLLGIMHAESAGDCSAVSVAGAQGCFQITDSAGAQQLANSYPERVADWYWAKRRLHTLKHSPWPPQAAAIDYYPRDLYVDPKVYFEGSPLWTEGANYRRQLRRTLDPVATDLLSPSYGVEVPVSSVASFAYGVVGSALYFQWAAHLLYAQSLLHPNLYDMADEPGLKAIWMAAAYNHGGPRGVILVERHGAQFEPHLWDEVRTYTQRVTSACNDLQQGTSIPEHTVSWLEFSDWMQELRWTYSSMDVNWTLVRSRVRGRFFAKGGVPLKDIVAVYDAMMRWDKALAPEQPILDFKMGSE